MKASEFIFPIWLVGSIAANIAMKNAGVGWLRYVLCYFWPMQFYEIASDFGRKFGERGKEAKS